MASYVAAGVPAQIIRVSYTTLFQVAAEYLGDAMHWTRIALMNGMTDPWITSLIELRIPVHSADWPTDGILGSWTKPENVVVTPTITALPAAPVAPAVTMSDLEKLIPYLPTELPDKPGVLWNNGGVVSVS